MITRAISVKSNIMKSLTLLIAQRHHLSLAFTDLNPMDRLDREIIAGEGEGFFLHVQGHCLRVAL